MDRQSNIWQQPKLSLSTKLRPYYDVYVVSVLCTAARRECCSVRRAVTPVFPQWPANDESLAYNGTTSLRILQYWTRTKKRISNDHASQSSATSVDFKVNAQFDDICYLTISCRVWLLTLAVVLIQESVARPERRPRNTWTRQIQVDSWLTTDAASNIAYDRCRRRGGCNVPAGCACKTNYEASFTYSRPWPKILQFLCKFARNFRLRGTNLGHKQPNFHRGTFL